MHRIISNIKIESTLCNNKKIKWDALNYHEKSFMFGLCSLYKKSLVYDAVVLNCGGNYLLLLSLLKKINPFYKTKIIAVEWNGVKPFGVKSRIFTFLKKTMLKGVDYFILLIKDLGNFNRYFGINENRSTYIPFKINMLEEISQITPSEGDYILTCGNRRDFQLVYNAVKDLKYKTKLICPPDYMLHSQGTYFPDIDDPPEHVEIIHHDGSFSTWCDLLSNSKLLVIPVNDHCIYAEGVSTYLEAMALKKCVITTDFEGTKGIIDNGEAILVPRGDVGALEKAIIKAWENDSYRNEIAKKGYKYAMSLGGEKEYHENIVNSVCEFLDKTKSQA